MIINVLIQLKLREARMLCSIQASDGTETETVGSSSRASSRTPIEQLTIEHHPTKEGADESEQSQCTISTSDSTISEDSAVSIVPCAASLRRYPNLLPDMCTICLTEFNTEDIACSSSNSECRHLFHQHCIINWLVSVGKSNTKSPMVLRECCDEELLAYALRCPCCRNDFHTISLR
ncbi:hypothetical protein ACHAWO_006524 [Cyclotella atomus]|uniref:RING-type domain-containing protein n=1 Tax=Cyclotella atomus TaxID=382360 RepID=A0ABD3MW15_9STRA